MRDRVILRLSNDNADTQFRITGRFRGTFLLKKDADVTIYRTHSIDPEEQKDEAILLRSTIRDFFIERFGDGAE